MAIAASGCTTSIRSSTALRLRRRRANSRRAMQARRRSWPARRRAGSQRYPMQSGGQSQSDWEGLAASIRAACHRHVRHSVLRPEVGGATARRTPRLNFICAGCRRRLRLAPRAFAPAPGATRGRSTPSSRENCAQLARISLPAAAVFAHDVTQGRATGLPLMRAMPLAFPDNALTRGTIRNSCAATRCWSRRSLQRAAKSRSRCRRAHGTTWRPGSASPGGRSSAIVRRSTAFRSSDAKVTRCHSARRPAHRGNRPDNPLNALSAFRQARGRARRLHAARKSPSPRTARPSRRQRGPGRHLRRRLQLDPSSIDSELMSAALAHAASIAVTVGEPAGIGPDLCVRLAERNWSARLVLIGDSIFCASARCGSISTSPSCRTSRPRCAAGALEVLHFPLANAGSRAGSTRQRHVGAGHARCRASRLRVGRIRGDGHRAGAKKRDQRRWHPVHWSHRISRAAHGDAPASS